MHKVGIVTVTFNSANVLPDFLKSLEGQDHPSFHLYAIDNASSDDTISILKSWQMPQLTIVANDFNAGVAGGNNQGITAALADGCDSILLLNNDVVFGLDLIRLLIAGLSDYACNMAVPLIYYYDPPKKIWCAGGTFQARYAARGIHYGEDEFDRGQFEQSRLIEYSPTCCTLIKREVFDVIGLMDERYFVYVDDNDFMYRAFKAGFKTFYLPHVKLWHKVNSLTGTDSPFAQRYLSRNRALFIRKHFGWWTVMRMTLIYRAIYCYRLLIGKDNFAAFERRQAGWTEGLGIR
ncbi:glycosyltransferase family 2 protein [Granulicella sp. WH15]|uniref:glycosyltransferase family 2 protein n=1 Tax=Granulicella sp. WH15 TaxID=2602070 RepID=UPI0013673DF9|nr:glycosyltransferase family 2 protein [Granulicella sp. WH15]QHN04321.1 glycosyltransferase family 2 protein [Granulicella sp. WH15]